MNGADLMLRQLPALRGQQSAPDPGEGEVENREMHFNYLQLLCLAVGAQYTHVVAGRGTGKTIGVLAPKLHRLLEKLHRSSIVLIGETYVQLITRTGPELLDGMRRLGYVDGVDFWIRRFPDKKLKLDMPYNCPIDPKYSWFFRNPGTNSVSVVRLVSQDRPGSANGLSVGAIIGDEAKLLDKHKLDSEVMAINRGGQEHWGGIAEHHSVTFTSDMPQMQSQRWILDAKEQALKPHHVRSIELILAIQLELYRERNKLRTYVRNATRLARIARYESYLNELRRGLVHYATSSSFANVHALTLAYFREKKRDFSPRAWKTFILNEEPDGTENGFYPALDTAIHGYNAVNYKYVDSRFGDALSFNDCRKDTDLDHNQELTIGMDYGASFNCMCVGQYFSRFHPMNSSGYNEVRHQQKFFVRHPELVQDVVAQFVEYYRPFLRKKVTYVYDPTATGKNGVTPMTYAHEVIKALKAAGWQVEEIYFAQVPRQDERYLAWNAALNEKDDVFARQRFNKENMRLVTQAMKNAGTKEGKRGLEKDKGPEGITTIDQATTTHLTDACDIVFWYLSVVVPNLQSTVTTLFGK